MSFHSFVIAAVALVLAFGGVLVHRMLQRSDGAPSYAAVFDQAFVPGFTVTTRATSDGTRVEQVPFKAIEAGMLKLPSGRIVAADPFIGLTDTKPFTQAVPAGTFPVRLAVGAFPAGGMRVTFARVDFKVAPVARWTMAVTADQDLATLKRGYIFGYGVDAGTGAFFDERAGKAAAEILEADETAWEAWQTDGEANGAQAVGPYSFLLDLPLGPANAIMFHSGWGDGYYASWFGYDAQGNVVALVTDFATIDWAAAEW